MSRSSRLTSVGLSAVLAGAGLIALAPAAQAAPDDRPVDIAAGWVTGQLTDGKVVGRYTFNGSEVTYTDYGLTADAAISLAEVGGYSSTLTEIADAVAPTVTEAYDSFGTIYTGSMAKAAVLFQVAGQDPTAVGEVDLISDLLANIATADGINGRIQNVGETSFPSGEPTDSANVFGQAFATRALLVQENARATDALQFLAKQQCDDGFFRLNFTADKAAADQTCQGAVGTAASDPSVDATAAAIIQLTGSGVSNGTISAIIDKAATWLADVQKADGSFGGGPTTTESNANSTGLAGWALGEAGLTAAAEKAAVWVRSRQVDEQGVCSTGLKAQTGAVAYDDATLAAGRANGITINTEDRWRRTTNPVFPVLQWAPAATGSLAATGPSGFVKGGTTVAYFITGIAPGSWSCVTTAGTSKIAVASTAGTARATFALPNTTATRSVGIRNQAGTAFLSTKALGSTTFKVFSLASVPKGSRVPVRVTGMAPGETLYVLFKGTLRATATAGADGVARASFVAPRTKGAGTITAWGQFKSSRSGSRSLTITG